MRRFMVILGILVPFAAGWLPALLAQNGTFVMGETVPLPVGALALFVVGLASGALAGRWWAVAAAPVLVMAGVLVGGLLVYGPTNFVQGPAAEWVPIAIMVFIAVTACTAPGAAVGVAIASMLRARSQQQTHQPAH